MASAWYIVGLGYSGGAIARAATGRGARVAGTTRDPAKAAAWRADGVDASVWSADSGLALPGKVADAVLCVTFAPSEVSNDALASLIHSAVAAGCQRVVYLSSTSVYAPADGDWVDDDGAVAPSTAMGARRVEAEACVAAAAGDVRVDVLRLPGIYGPGRTGRDRFFDGSYRVPGDGSHWSNRIHRDDIASAALAVGTSAANRRVWLAVDDTPFQLRPYADWVCAALGLPVLPATPWSEIPARSLPFYAGNRRMRASGLHAIGWRPAYPSYREGLAASWAAEDGTGADG